MIIESFSLIANYTYMILSGIIGYILWQKFFSENYKKKLKEKIDYQLEWISLSILVFLNLLIILFFIYSINHLSNNDLNNLFGFFLQFLEVINIFLGIIFAILVVLLYNIEKDKCNKEYFIQGQKNVLLFYLLIFIVTSSFFYIYNPVENFSNFIIISIFLLFFLSFYLTIFNLNFSLKNTVWIFLIYIVIGIVTMLITNFFIVNKITTINEEFQNFICEDDYYECYNVSKTSFSIDHNLIKYYYLEYNRKVDSQLKEIKFKDINGKEVIDIPYYIYRANETELKNIEVISLKKNDDLFAFSLDKSIRKDVEKIELIYWEGIDYKKNKLIEIDESFSENIQKINLTKNILLPVNFEKVEINRYNSKSKCSFEENKYDFNFINHNRISFDNRNIKFELEENNGNYLLFMTGYLNESNYLFYIQINCE